MAGYQLWEGGMAEKIIHPILVGLLHSEGGNSGRSFQSCITFCSPASQATSAVDVSCCACKCDTVWVTVTAAPSRGTLHLHSPENSVSETPEQQWLLQRYNEIIWKVKSSESTGSPWLRVTGEDAVSTVGFYWILVESVFLDLKGKWNNCQNRG